MQTTHTENLEVSFQKTKSCKNYIQFSSVHSGIYQPALQTQFYCHGIPNGEYHIQGIGQTSNSYSTVARDLSLKTIPRPRAQPEGERLFSTINPMATVL